MSAFLSTTMPRFRDVIEALIHEALADKVKTIVGGAPVNQQYADEVGADGFAPNTILAVDRVKELMKE